MKKILGMVLMGLLCVGCSRERKEAVSTPAFEIKVGGDAGELMIKVDEHYRSGNINGAIDTLSRALREKKYESDRGMLFACLLNMLINAGRADEARSRYIESIEVDEEFSRSGYEVLLSYYASAEDPNALVEWTGALLDLPLPDNLAFSAFSSHLNACLKAGSFSNVVDLVPVCIEKFDDGPCGQMFAGLIGNLVSSGMYSEASTLLDTIESVRGDSAILKALVETERINMLFVQGRWIEAEKQFMQACDKLGDRELAVCLRRVSPLALKGGQPDMLDRLCGSILKNQRGKPAARLEAASQCLAVGKQSRNNAEIMRRMDLLMQFDMPPEDVFSFFRAHFYDVIQEGKKEDLLQALRFGDRLTPLLTEDKDKDEAKSLALDLSFMAEDYERSLAILDEGSISQDGEWFDMASNKIRAHMALRDGNKKEAVERFRKFMDHVATWEEAEYDPSTGLSHTREMCLGFNAARIGDVLSSMGDESGAATAYVEARDYYERALAETAPGKREYDHIQAALAKLPKPGAAPAVKPTAPDQAPAASDKDAAGQPSQKGAEPPKADEPGKGS